MGGLYINIMNRTTREEYNNYPLGFYHLCLDRLEGRKLFYSDNDYRMGMAGMGLSTLKFGVTTYAFELMHNHLHDILRATGEQCMQVFSYMKRRISEQLIKNGYPPLPDNYGCKLRPITNENDLRDQIIYSVRNPYEKGYCVPGGHRWGSSYLYFNELASFIRGEKVSSMSQTRVRAQIGSKETLPPDWEIHPVLGVLPRNFVKAEEVMRLFASPKDFHTRLVKEYETAVVIARSLGEEIEFSMNEVRDIANTELRNTYPGRLFKSLSREEKCIVAVNLNERLGLSPRQLSQTLYLSELTITQAIRSKDYGIIK